MSAEAFIRTYLDQHVFGARNLWSRAEHADWTYRTVEELVQAHGRFYTPAPLPPRFEQAQPRACYENAAMLALEHPELTYVEGYAAGLIPTPHAWVTEDGTSAIDPTWAEPGAAYFGVPFSTEWLHQHLTSSGHWGVFFMEMADDPLRQMLRQGVPPHMLA